MVTKEQFEARVEEARRWVASGDELAVTVGDQVIAALAEERDGLAKMNAELLRHADAYVRLLGDLGHHDLAEVATSIARIKEGT